MAYAAQNFTNKLLAVFFSKQNVSSAKICDRLFVYMNPLSSQFATKLKITNSSLFLNPLYISLLAGLKIGGQMSPTYVYHHTIFLYQPIPTFIYLLCIIQLLHKKPLPAEKDIFADNVVNFNKYMKQFAGSFFQLPNGSSIIRMTFSSDSI